MNPPPRRLYTPKPTKVRAKADGVPVALGSVSVLGIREQWLVEDRWWTSKPLRRRYFELILADGRNVVVFHSASERRWYLQRA